MEFTVTKKQYNIHLFLCSRAMQDIICPRFGRLFETEIGVVGINVSVVPGILFNGVVGAVMRLTL